MSEVQCTSHHNACDCRESKINELVAHLSAKGEAERARADSLTASITAACDGTGCLNAHELAEALRDARAKLAVTEADVTHYQDMLRVSDEALRQARADRDVLAAMCRVHLESTPAKHGWVTRVVSAKNAVLASGALSRVNGGGE